MFDLNRFIFPLVSAIPASDHLRIQRFLGCGFWLDRYGHFATCKHVLELVADDEVPVIGQPGGPDRGRYVPILESLAHADYDMAIGCAPASAVGGFLEAYDGEIGLGLDVQAFGYTAGGKEGVNLHVDPRLLRGHISRFAESFSGVPSPSLIEVSFGSPSGFSGTPLLVDRKVVGVMYGNVDSKLEAYSIEEVSEGESKYREVAYRIYEYGIAHRLSDFTAFFKEVGVGQPRAR